MNAFTLIHLVSEQTLQNLLPIMAFRPGRIVQVRSRGLHRVQLESIEAAVRHLAESYPDFGGHAPTFVDYELSEEYPTVNQVYADLAPWFADPENTVLNYTGGTKMISVGAFQLAFERNVRTLYCDSARRRFVWAPEGGALNGLDFDQLSKYLTVSLIAAANGQEPGSLRSKPIEPEQLEFGRAAWPFKLKATPAFLDFEGQLRSHFRCHEGKIPASREKLDELVRKPLPAPRDGAVLEFLCAAAAARLLKQEGGNFFPFCRASQKRDLKGALETLSNLLEGSWLELFVVDLLHRNPAFGDMQWSLEPIRQQDRALGETDVVCVDRVACRLLVISCKQSLQNRAPLEHMEALVQRARTLGGSHARAMLAVLRVGEDEEEKYRNWAESLGVELLIGDQISARFQAQSGGGITGAKGYA
ncbi:MAG: DUF1887 family protein [Acidobacteria bacterium]|nr:DUF1887 family protein [Acidobacteriota bacterium]